MIDVKRLVVIFLVLAVIASVGAFSLSNYGVIKNAGLGAGGTLAGAAMPQNAFVAATEDLPIVLRGNLSGIQTNLTAATAKNLAEVITSLNPEGPRDFNGQFGLVLPTSSVLATYLMAKSPDFQIADLWSNVQDSDLRITAANDTATNDRFNENFKKVMQATVGSPSFLAELSQASDPNAAGDIATTLGVASLGLKSIETPAAFVPFEKNFINYLQDQKNVLLVIDGQSVDPLKATIVLNSEDEISNRIGGDLVAMAKAYQALDPAQLLSQSNPAPQNGLTTAAAALADFFRINTARAQVGFSIDTKTGACTLDTSQATSFFNGLSSGLGGIQSFVASLLAVPVVDKTTESNTGQSAQIETVAAQSAMDILTLLVYQCNRNIQTAVVKNNAVDTLNAVTLDYVQNNGDPRFITNYGDYINDASTKGATAAYQSVSSEICPEFVSSVDSTIFNPNTAVGASGKIGGDTIINNLSGTGGVNGTGNGCGIKSQVSDLNGFYNNFSSDPNAWDDYFSLMSNPSNNFFGTLATSHDVIDSAARSSASAAQTESVANQGAKSDTQCTNSYTDANSNVICTNEQIVTPGNTISSQIKTAVNSGYQQVVSANDLARLNAAVTDALGTELINGKTQGLYNLALKFGTDNPITINDICNGLSSVASACNKVTAEIDSINNQINSIVAKANSVINIINQINGVLNLF